MEKEINNGQALSIRDAGPADAALIVVFIRELAEYEKLADEAVLTEELLHRHLFGLKPRAKVLLAFWDRKPAGFALYFFNFSTFVGKPGLYLEDIFVRPEYRSKGIGRSLMAALAEIAAGNDCGRMEWAVLDWNTPAIEFYKNLGARPMDEWTVFRLTPPALKELTPRK